MKRFMTAVGGFVTLAAAVAVIGPGWSWHTAIASDAVNAAIERAELRATTKVNAEYILRQQIREEEAARARGESVPPLPTEMLIPDGLMLCPGKPNRVCTMDGRELTPR